MIIKRLERDLESIPVLRRREYNLNEKKKNRMEDAVESRGMNKSRKVCATPGRVECNHAVIKFRRIVSRKNIDRRRIRTFF